MEIWGKGGRVWYCCAVARARARAHTRQLWALPYTLLCSLTLPTLPYSCSPPAVAYSPTCCSPSYPRLRSCLDPAGAVRCRRDALQHRRLLHLTLVGGTTTASAVAAAAAAEVVQQQHQTCILGKHLFRCLPHVILSSVVVPSQQQRQAVDVAKK